MAAAQAEIDALIRRTLRQRTRALAALFAGLPLVAVVVLLVWRGGVDAAVLFGGVFLTALSHLVGIAVVFSLRGPHERLRAELGRKPALVLDTAHQRRLVCLRSGLLLERRAWLGPVYWSVQDYPALQGFSLDGERLSIRLKSVTGGSGPPREVKQTVEVALAPSMQTSKLEQKLERWLQKARKIARTDARTPRGSFARATLLSLLAALVYVGALSGLFALAVELKWFR